MPNANSLALASQPSAPATATETVFETILADIVRGTYPPGARLPAERELARMLGASRPTLREALRRLSEWQLIEPRRGSGVVVKARAEWSIEALPAYLRYAKPGPGEAPIGQLLIDLLSLRRSLLVEVVGMVAGRMPEGGTARAREAVERAWALRDDAPGFIVADFQVIRTVVESVSLWPAVWILNRLAGVYFDIADTVSGHVSAPDDYLASLHAVLDAIDARDTQAARERMNDYLLRHDQRLLAPLEMMR